MDIGVFCCLFVVCIYIHVRLVMSSYLLSVISSMLGVSHAVQNEKKPYEFTEWERIYVISILMLNVSHAVELLVLGLMVCKIPYSSCILNTAVVVVACVISIHGFSRCRGYWICVFCCLFAVRIYICSAGYVELPVLLYLFQCLVYHILSKTRRSSGNLHRVIVEVLVSTGGGV